MKSLLLIILTLVALPVFGQTTPGYPNVPQALVRYFALTPEQGTSIRGLNQSLSDYFDLKFERWDLLDQEVTLELQKTSPDPAQVGAKVVEMVMIDRDVEQEVQMTVTKVQAVLTTEQKEKVKVLEEAMRLSSTIFQAQNWLFIAPSTPNASVAVTGLIPDTSAKEQPNSAESKLSRAFARKSWRR